MNLLHRKGNWVKIKPNKKISKSFDKGLISRTNNCIIILRCTIIEVNIHMLHTIECCDATRSVQTVVMTRLSINSFDTEIPELPCDLHTPLDHASRSLVIVEGELYRLCDELTFGKCYRKIRNTSSFKKNQNTKCWFSLHFEKLSFSSI